MLRLLLFCIVAAQALDYNSVVHMRRWTLKAAHHVVSKHVEVSWKDLKQIQDHYRVHHPMQIRNTDKQWSVDHAFRFLLKHGRQMKVASIKAQPKGFDFKGTLHGVHYKLKCTHRCHVHRTGHADFNQEFALHTPGDATQAAETLIKQENDRKLDLLAGESIRPSADSSLSCLRVIASEDCEYHDYLPLHNKQLCREAMNDAVPEAAEDGIIIPVITSASNLEGRSSPDCSTNGHVIIFNKRGENLYVVADGTVQTPLGLMTNWKTVPSHAAGAQEAPGDVGCSKHEPCICQYKKAHAKANHTGERVLCDDVHDDYINRTMLHSVAAHATQNGKRSYGYNSESQCETMIGIGNCKIDNVTGTSTKWHGEWSNKTDCEAKCPESPEKKYCNILQCYGNEYKCVSHTKPRTAWVCEADVVQKSNCETNSMKMCPESGEYNNEAFCTKDCNKTEHNSQTCEGRVYNPAEHGEDCLEEEEEEDSSSMLTPYPTVLILVSFISFISIF